jgi:hypothetical protein
MKNIYITTAIVTILSATTVVAQTTTGVGTGGVIANANPNERAVADATSGLIDGRAASRTGDERATAQANGVGGEASASVAEGVILNSRGNGVGGPNIAAVGINGTAVANNANANIQFQIGNDNTAVNVQVGTQQESGTVQVGNENVGFISQTSFGNEAALSQVGDNNNTALIQDGSESAAASATFGNGNSALGLQEGGDDNILAFAQVGDGNAAVTFQSGAENTASTLQLGDDNTSYINQGGVSVGVSLAAVDGTAFAAGLPSEFTLADTTGLGVWGSTSNSAASLQIGTYNVSAIIQTGERNEAVNYQAN